MIYCHFKSFNIDRRNNMDFSSQNPATSNVLNLAARNNDVDNVARLLKKFNPNNVDNRGWTCLHEAAHADSYESLMLILKCPRTRGRAETHEGHTALYLACKNNCSLKTVRALLDSVRNIANYGSTEGVTPLHIASSLGNVELIELLIKYGAIIDVQDFDGDTPLHEAALAAQNGAMITLLYAGADPDIKNNPGGFTPFHLACCKGYLPNVQTLLPFVSDINHQTVSGETPLHFALHGANEEIVYFLLENGADPNIMNSSGEMPLDLALTTNAKVLKKLLAVTDRAKINKNIIINACKPHKFQYKILQALLFSDLGPEFYNVVKPFNMDMTSRCLTHSSYLTHAPLNHYLYICGYIYKKSSSKFREFFYLFLMQGVSVNSLSATECPPLVYLHTIHHADPHLYPSCFSEVLNILIEHGCDVDFCSSGKTLKNDICISDAFLTSLDIYPWSGPIMMPYSLYNEPGKYLQFAIENNFIGTMPLQVQKELLMMIDKSFDSITPESLEYHVPSLKHLCRYRIRSYFRNKTKPDINMLEDYSTTSFLDVIKRLPVPPIIKNYLRYIEY